MRSHVGLQIARVAELFLTLDKWTQHRHFFARLTVRIHAVLFRILNVDHDDAGVFGVEI
jgi:hypothetical protein